MDEQEKTERELREEKYKITIIANGPYLVQGGVPLDKLEMVENGLGGVSGYRLTQTYDVPETYALCRCGASKNKPFCDGSHEKIGFNGTETADPRPYLEQQIRTIEGPDLILTDAIELCVPARFCHSGGGNVWDNTEDSNVPSKRERAIKQACNCPSGRLVAWDKKTRQPIEPEYEKSISVLVDKPVGVGGPYWVKGGIPIESADGTVYPVRNRVTLCRCGASENKPFCQGSHINIGFEK